MLMCGSLREGSFNRKLLLACGKLLEEHGAKLDRIDLREYAVPSYDGDLETRSGVPDATKRLQEKFRGCDAWVIASPEYNHSIPGHFKNTLDWLTRLKPVPWKGKPTLLLSASPGLTGGNRGLWALRVPIEATGAVVYPEMYSLAQAGDAAFSGDLLSDEAKQKRLIGLVDEFLRFAGALSAVGA